MDFGIVVDQNYLQLNITPGFFMNKTIWVDISFHYNL